jgi:predicted CXXCH cytochrome family protein
MLRMPRRCLPILALITICAPAGTSAQPAPAANTCLACHATLTDAKLAAPARLFSGPDVHRERGFACVDCHGGDSGNSDKARAHDGSRGFKGAPIGQAQIVACARCHSDATLMRRFSPKQRVDQAAEYATSVHGKQLAAGHTNVATCASCHGPHGIRPVSDAKSPVFPANVAATCAACHADPRHMAGYTLHDGKPLPTTQFADYQKSVHYAALTRGNDLSAPTCNDCHGNHGATPPGVGAVANVCGTCHAVFAARFQTSVHAQIFDKGCVECHANHAVLKPSDAMLGSAGPAICATCHTGADDKGGMAADAMHRQFEQLEAGIRNAKALLDRVQNAGIEVSDQELALREAATKLTLARTEMHAFDPATVAPIIADGTRIVAGVDGAGQKGVAELRFRRRGLAVSLGAILLLVVALGLKVRSLDRHPQP